MSYRSSRKVLFVTLVVCLVFGIPLSARATVGVSKVPVEVGAAGPGRILADAGALAYTLRVYEGSPVYSVYWPVLAADAQTGAMLGQDVAGDIPDLGDFDGKWIVFRDSPVSSYIKAFNVASGESSLVASIGFTKTLPLVDNNRVVWGEYDSFGAITYMITDMSTGVTKQLVADWNSDFLSFSGDKLVYSYTDLSGSKALGMFDVNTGATAPLLSLPDNAVYDLNNTSVVWSTPSASGSDFYRKDFNTGVVTSLGSVSQKVGSFESDDRLIAWSSSNGSDFDVWCFDTLLSKTFLVAGGAGDQGAAAVTGMHVAYVDRAIAENDGDIYSATLSYTMPDLGKVTVPRQVKVGAQAKLSAAFSNPDKSDTATVVWDFGDGATETFDVGASGRSRSSHAYATAGTYEGSVTITDASGMKDTAKFTVVVR